MNKNFIFLAIILSVTANEAFAGGRKTKHRDHFDTADTAADDDAAHKTRIALQNKARDQRADRRTMIKEQEALKTLTTIIELCFASQFDQAAELMKQKNLSTLTDSRGYNILQIACELYPFANDENIDLAATLVFLIEQGANQNHRNNENQTILHIACQNDLGEQLEPVLDLILQHLDPALINAIDNHGRHALHYACLNSSDATNYFIQHNIGQAFLCHRDDQNMTPMCLAAISNSNQLTELVNFRAGAGDILVAPPLLWAAVHNMPSVVTGLIRNGHNVNTITQEGVTALHIAIVRSHIVDSNLAVIQLLLAVPGINVNAANQVGNTPMHLAVIHGGFLIVQALLATQNINVNAANDSGNTPLHEATELGHIRTTQALLAIPDINVNAINNDRETPLHTAAFCDNLEIVQALLAARGIDVNARSNGNKTPLHTAVAQNHLEIVQALLAARGVDVNAQDNDNKTPLHTAVAQNHLEIVQALLAARGVDVNAVGQRHQTALHNAVLHGNLAIVQALLQAHAINVNALTQGGFTALHIAVLDRHREIVQVLLNTNGINVNVNAADRMGCTALHIAAGSGNTETVLDLLAAPAINIHATDQWGYTILHCAVQSGGNLATVQALLNTPGINVNAASLSGLTVLHTAALHSSAAIIQTLLDRGADTTLRTRLGETAAGIAHTPEIRQLILGVAARQQ